ncbi:MAG TPA: protein kinase [Pirellulales bacterium]|nr:protein kinase [Pirellulales bacterium]
MPGTVDAGSLLEGEQLGQFVLEKFVGGGGMGIVFRALDTTLNREVAVKVLSRDQSADDEALRRFRNEAQSAARLDHDNIARVHYVGEDRGVHYIVFEYIEGVNIRDLVTQKGPLPLDEAISYAFQIAQALDHASQRAVIHRDIKPSNVLITPDGKAKLVDMGLARLNQVAHAQNDLTASGVTLGTFDYISPEQARDPRSADVRSDMYSLGCSFFYMLTGRPPFAEGTVLQKLLQHQGDLPPDPRSFRPELPADVTRILARLLAKNPAQRFQQPSELISELSTLADTLGVQLSSPRLAWSPSRVSPPARWRHHLPWIVPLAALFVIVLVLDRFGSSSSSERPRPAPVARESSPTAALPGRISRNSPAKAAPRSTTSSVRADAEQPSAPPLRAEARPPKNEPEAAEPQPTASEADVERQLPGQLGPLLQRLAKAWGAELKIESSGGRAAAAPNVGSQAGPEPLGSPSELGVSADEPESPARVNRGTPAAAPPREGILVVSDVEGPQNYPTLRAALADAKSGDVIELRYNGRRAEKPLTISNTRLTLRAAANCQPIIMLRPESNPVEFPPSMITIAGGQLTAAGIHWELDLPRDVAADWALFETRQAELVRFENCTFTIRNASLNQSAYHAGVAFFDIKAAPGMNMMSMDPSTMEDQVVTIDLQNCVARGEATLLRNNELQSLHLNWDNGLLATSERLLSAAGGPALPRRSGSVQIHLRHVTAAVHDGLALLTNSEDAPYQLPTHIDAVDTILLSTARQPLVEQRGSDTVDEYLRRLQWSGEHDFVEGFGALWQILSSTSATGSKQMSFDAWQSFWGDRLHAVSNAPLAWKGLPAATRAFHTHTPADYALDARAKTNPAVNTASDGLEVGLLAAKIAALPAEERSEARPVRRANSAAKGVQSDP